MLYIYILADTLKCADCHYEQGLENAMAIPVERHQELNGSDSSASQLPGFSYSLKNMQGLNRDMVAYEYGTSLGTWEVGMCPQYGQ